MTGLSDSFHRPINYLRVSVTDRCNLRCVYCMPEEGIPLLPRQGVPRFEEIYAVVRAAAELGISKVRLTGGEPLIRIGLTDLVRMLSAIKGIDDIALTTNGMLLAERAVQLKQAGLRRVNVSLDSLIPARFRAATRGGDVSRVLDGIGAARAAGLNPVKLNVVVMGGINDDEIPDFARRTIADGWNVRFIERMPFTDTRTTGRFMPVSEIRQQIERLGVLEPCHVTAGNGPAKYFRLPGAAGTIGFITPVSEHFCFHCNRLRLTADGKLRPCLLSQDEIDLRTALRRGAAADEVKKLIEMAVAAKPVGHSMTPSQAGLNRPFSQIGG